MWYRSIKASASETSAPVGSVIGSTIIPASERFTLSTSPTWAPIGRLRWTMPSPPSRASAIARRASVTVSIAAETTGTSKDDRPGQPGCGGDIVRENTRLGRHEENVIERQPFLRKFLRERGAGGLDSRVFRRPSEKVTRPPDERRQLR